MKSAQRGRKLLFGALIGFLLLVLVALLLPALVDTSEIKGILEQRIREQTGRSAQIQHVRLSLWSGISLLAEGFTLSEAPEYGTLPFLEAESLRIGLSLRSLLQGRQEPSSLEITGVVLHLRENAEGWNFESLAKASSSSALVPASSTTGRAVQLPAVSIRDGRVLVYQQGKAAPWPLKNLSLTLTPGFISSDYSFSLDSRLETPKGDSALKASGRFAPPSPGQKLPDALRTDFSLTAMPLESLADFLQGRAKEFKMPPIGGLLGVTGSLTPGNPGEWVFSGRLALDDMKRTDTAAQLAPLSLRVDCEASLFPNRVLLEVRKLEMGTGDTRIRISGRIQDLLKSPQASLRVSSTAATPMDLLRFAALLRGGAIPAGTEGRLSFDLGVEGPLSSPRMKGSLDSEKLSFQYPDLKEPVTVSSIHVDLDGESLRTNRFSAGVGSEALLAIAAEATDLSQDPSVNLQVQTTRPVPLKELLRIGSSFGLRLPAQMQVESGSAALDINAQGLRLKSRRFRVRGQLTLENAVCRLASLREAVSVPSIRMEMREGQIRSNRFAVEMGADGALSAEFLVTDSAAGPDVQASIRSTRPLDAEHWLEAGRAFALQIPGGVKLKGGKLSCDLDLKSSAGREPQLQGLVQFQDGELRSDLAAEPLVLRRITAEMQSQQVTLRELDAQFLGTNLSGTATVLLGKQPRITLAARADRINVNRLKAALGITGSAPKRAPQVAGGEKTPPFYQTFSGEGKISVRHLTNDNLELTNLDAAFNYSRKVLQIAALNFDLYSGKHQGSLYLDLNGDTPAFQYQGKLQSVDVHELLSRNTSMVNILYGQFDSTSAISGRGGTPDAISASSTGHGIYRLSNGRITTFNLGQQIALLTRLAGWKFEGKTTELQEVDGSFRLEGNRIHLEKSRIKTPEADVVCDGSIGLDQSLDLRGTAELSDQWKEPGNIVGQIVAGAASTFFRNESGKIVVPFHLRGTVENPAFVLDPETAQKALSQVLRPENIQSGVKTIEDLIRKAGKAVTTTTPIPPAVPPAGASGPSTTTTIPPKPADLIGGIGSLVGGILGAVQQSQSGAQSAGRSGVPALSPNVTDLVQELNSLASMPAALGTQAERKARIDRVLGVLFAVPSPPPTIP